MVAKHGERFPELDHALSLRIRAVILGCRRHPLGRRRQRESIFDVPTVRNFPMAQSLSQAGHRRSQNRQPSSGLREGQALFDRSLPFLCFLSGHRQRAVCDNQTISTPPQIVCLCKPSHARQNTGRCGCLHGWDFALPTASRHKFPCPHRRARKCP